MSLKMYAFILINSTPNPDSTCNTHMREITCNLVSDYISFHYFDICPDLPTLQDY
jgi:hypothetical protein